MGDRPLLRSRDLQQWTLGLTLKSQLSFSNHRNIFSYVYGYEQMGKNLVTMTSAYSVCGWPTPVSTWEPSSVLFQSCGESHVMLI